MCQLCEMFPELEHDPRGGAYSPAQRMCIFLTYCAENGYEYKVGHLLGPKKSTVSSIVEEVATVLCARSREFIKMPTRAEMRDLSDYNEDNYNIPNCPMGVDGKL